MSKYTIRVKDIMENYYILKQNKNNQQMSLADFNEISLPDTIGTWDNPFQNKYKNYESPFDKAEPTVDEIIKDTWQDLFDFNYPKLPSKVPIGELETKIIKHYYMREIGFETIGRFKLALNETLNRIMPYYTDLYNSIELNGDNPLENYDLIDHSERNTTGSSNSSSTGQSSSNGNAKQVFEDTPSNELGAGTNYATNVTKNDAESTENSSGTSEGTQESNDIYDRHAHGIMGYNKQDLLFKYRENLINVEELIIMELRDLFMLLY